MGSVADLHVVAFSVAGLAALALGGAVGADVAVHDITCIGLAVAAGGVSLFFDHQLAVVPARFGRRLAARAVLLDEAHLALALVVELVVGAQVALALRRCKTGARAPVALQERQVLLLLGLGRHDHRLGRVLLVLVGVRLLLLILVLVLALILVLRAVRPLVGAGLVLVFIQRRGDALAIEALAVAALDRNGGTRAHDHAVGADDASRAVAALARRSEERRVGKEC